MTNDATGTVIVHATLDAAVQKTGLTLDGMQSLRVAFAPHFADFQKVREDAAGVPATAAKKAREIRLRLKDIRVSAEKTRKELKEDSLRRGKAIDGIKAVLDYELVPIEKALLAIEDAEEIAEKKRKDELSAKRSAEIAEYADPTFYDLAGMPEQQWQDLLKSAIKAHHDRAEAAKKAEADRIEAARLAAEALAQKVADDLAERQRMQEENIRLAKVAADERAAREASEAASAKARAESDRVAAEERAKADAARVAAEKATADKLAEAKRIADEERRALELKASEERDREQVKRLAAERVAADARAAADRLAAEERAKATDAHAADKKIYVWDAAKAKAGREKAEAELKAQRDADAARVQAEEDARKKAAAAPDALKVAALAATIRTIRADGLTSEAGKALAGRIAEQAAKFAAWLDAEAAKL